MAAPVLMTATPPAGLARRSCSFYGRQSESLFSISLADLATTGDGVGITGALDDGGLVLVTTILPGLAQQRDVSGLERRTDLFR